MATLDGDTLDASLLRLNEVGFLAADDPRFAEHGARDRAATAPRATSSSATSEADDFGMPENAFLVCTFWYINALAALGRRDEARALFEKCSAAATATACWPSTSTR